MGGKSFESKLFVLVTLRRSNSDQLRVTRSPKTVIDFPPSLPPPFSRSPSSAHRGQVKPRSRPAWPALAARFRPALRPAPPFTAPIPRPKNQQSGLLEPTAHTNS